MSVVFQLCNWQKDSIAKYYAVDYVRNAEKPKEIFSIFLPID